MPEEKINKLVSMSKHIYTIIEGRVQAKIDAKKSELPPEIPPNYTNEQIKHMVEVEKKTVPEMNKILSSRSHERQRAQDARREYAKAHGGVVPLRPKRVSMNAVILELIERGHRAFEEDEAKKQNEAPGTELEELHVDQS